MSRSLYFSQKPFARVNIATGLEYNEQVRLHHGNRGGEKIVEEKEREEGRRKKERERERDMLTSICQTQGE